MIVNKQAAGHGQFVAGEWRTLSAHEYTVYADLAGRWSSVFVVEYGEWNEYTEEEARAYFPADILAEIDRELNGGE